MKPAQMNGFTLIELMITMGVLAVVAAIAIPAYTGYVATSRLTEGWNNLHALNAAEVQFSLDNNGVYFDGASAATLKTNSGNLWTRAEASGENFTYVVALTATGYTATASGTNKLASGVQLRCTITSGQTTCAKL